MHRINRIEVKIPLSYLVSRHTSEIENVILLTGPYQVTQVQSYLWYMIFIFIVRAMKNKNEVNEMLRVSGFTSLPQYSRQNLIPENIYKIYI